MNAVSTLAELASSRRRKVTLAAAKFGPTQGTAAQTWVQEAIEAGNLYDDFKSDTLMEMQLTLFAECSVDDESGKCKDLSEAIEALTVAVADRKKNPKTTECEPPAAVPHNRRPARPPRLRSSTSCAHAARHPLAVDFDIALGATPIQEAATKLRSAATLFGPEQKTAADAWIKKVISGEEMSKASGLLEEQVGLCTCTACTACTACTPHAPHAPHVPHHVHRTTCAAHASHMHSMHTVCAPPVHCMSKVARFGYSLCTAYS